MSTDSRPQEVTTWIKRHINKKHNPIVVDPSDFGPRLAAWWMALQPSWRVLSDGQYSKDTPDDENWAMLRKGGSSGLYIVVVALSWWVHVLGPDDNTSSVWMIVDDLWWVLIQLHGTTKHGKRNHSDGEIQGREKRFVCFFN